MPLTFYGLQERAWLSPAEYFQEGRVNGLKISVEKPLNRLSLTTAVAIKNTCDQHRLTQGRLSRSEWVATKL